MAEDTLFAHEAGSRTRDIATAAAIAALGVATAAIVARLVGDWRFVAGLVAGFAILAALALTATRRAPPVRESEFDRTLLRAALDAATDAAALTVRGGAIVVANSAYVARFGAALPEDIDGDALAMAARRDGTVDVALGSAFRLQVSRVGGRGDHLLWQTRDVGGDAAAEASRAIAGLGARFGEAGVMMVLIDGGGRILAGNGVFATRALGRSGDLVGRDFSALLEQDAGGALRFSADRGEGEGVLRLLHVPVSGNDVAGAAVILLFDDVGEEKVEAAPSDVQELLHMLPLGLALTDRDGRFLFVNDAFARIAQVPAGERPVYPGDLVVKEDKAAVADAVRRFAAARSPTSSLQQAPFFSGDIAVRLARRPDEPVSLTVATVRGMGPAAVLLSLKDSGEESRLKRQVNQANKMQAVGQLAGGIAHDFNNILTALIGHCDLMLMRHTPGDSDYDDIQQIRNNGNRAASLTRQLLAFSRQQTLRPQIIQLPDIVSEVSNLLKRLLGDATRLEINHGRALGPVRADPGQLEQVIVNLAVNARDAMPGGGTITIRTFAVAAAEVRHLGPDILPAGDYTAIAVSDTGTGIAPADLPKIFDPFFTTKEVGKGTGLGLSTVYGIVKQSGGFIFADSTVGRGTSFVIYLPVFRGEAIAETSEKPAPSPALWGSGRILVVEDEEMVRSVAERALSRQGYQVSTAANGEEALELLALVDAEGEGFDLLVSDVMMPILDGPTMVAEARRRFPGLPVLFMSGYAEEQLRRSIDLPDVAFIAKPFSVQQLAEATRDALAAAAARADG